MSHDIRSDAVEFLSCSSPDEVVGRLAFGTSSPLVVAQRIVTELLAEIDRLEDELEQAEGAAKDWQQETRAAIQEAEKKS